MADDLSNSQYGSANDAYIELTDFRHYWLNRVSSILSIGCEFVLRIALMNSLTASISTQDEVFGRDRRGKDAIAKQHSCPLK
jgi:hypothetical protein